MDDHLQCAGNVIDSEQTQLEESFGVQRWCFHGRVRALRAGGAGVNISKGQQVWLCWDLEPAADVLLSSGRFPLEGGSGGGDHH